MEVVRKAEANPDIDAGRVLDKVVDDYQGYVNGPVTETLNEFANETAELNFYIASFPPDLPPEMLQAAIDN